MSDNSLTDPAPAAARSPQPEDLWGGLGVPGLRRLRAAEIPAGWRLSTFSGRLGEISGAQAAASLTLVFRLVLEAQKQGEPVAWITCRESTFFPPDVAEAGIDLFSLAVIRAPDTNSVARATEHLLRSGSFGLLVMDLGAEAHLPLHAQSRLAGQARKHSTALLCITEKESSRPSLGPLFPLRAHTVRRQEKGDRFCCEVHFVKDKRRGPGWRGVEVCRGPDGLR